MPGVDLNAVDAARREEGALVGGETVAEARHRGFRGQHRRVGIAGGLELPLSSTTVMPPQLPLLPVLTLTGRGADIMIPMAIPAFGGMSMALLTLFIVPVLYCWRMERGVGRG
jgi:Cu(I)/Ag(I) efflux system membrane protein CusA/SilA